MNCKLLHFISINVRGIRNKQKRDKIFKWLSFQKFDIVLMQETFVTKDLENVLKLERNCSLFFNNGTNHSKGVIIGVKHNSQTLIKECIRQPGGRVIGLRITQNDKCYLVVNVYAPTKSCEKINFFKHLYLWLKKHKHVDDMLLIGGDWNSVQNPRMDTHGLVYAYKPISWLSRICKTFNLVDIWRKCHPTVKQFTWRQNSLGYYSRLDYWLIPYELCSFVHSTDIRPILKCDHNAVSLKLKLSSSARGKGVWKFNNALLQDMTFKETIRNIVKKVILENKSYDNQMLWDFCKIKIKEYSIKFSKTKQNLKNKLYYELQRKLETLSQTNDENPNEDYLKEIEKVTKQIDKLLEYKCKGAFIRSRERWMEEGEKSSKYFFNLEKRNGVKKELDSVKKERGVILDREKILEEIYKYYKELYSRKKNPCSSEIDIYLDGVEFNTLSEEDASSCEGLLTENECYKALMSMPNNKTPGSDGLSAEFYKCFWEDINNLVINSLNEGFEKNELSETQKQGNLILLYKKGDKRLLDNWRPISLLNIDYKILAKVICKRLQNVINKIISIDQTGYLKLRSATENVRLVEDVIDYCLHLNIPGILLFIDFKKAFDNVDHHFLCQLLQRYQFKDSFIHWIKVMYNNTSGKVINNGWVTQTFKIEQGVRQGCPLSALLFLLVADVMTRKIKQNENIRGISIPTAKETQFEYQEIKISQLADDTVIFVNSVKSGNTALEEIEKFGEIAGPKINLTKTNAITTSLQTECLSNVQWTTDPVKHLGIYVGKDKRKNENMNWDNKLIKIQSILNMWKMRNLTLYGKIVVLKALVVSQIVYAASAIHVPDNLVRKLEKMMYTFLWGSKREKIKRTVCINSPEEGGLGMIDLRSKLLSLKLSWIPKYLKYHDQPWMYLFHFWISKIGPLPLCFRFNCSKKDMSLLCMKRQLPSFYFDLMSAWCDIRFNASHHVADISREIIWYNSNIKFKRNMLFFKKWHDYGVVYVHQLLQNYCWKPIETIHHMLDCKSLLIDFEYSKLKKAIPNEWLKKHKRTCDELIEEHFFEIRESDTVNLINMKTKDFYLHFIKHKKSEPQILNYWQNKLELPPNFEWKYVLQFKMRNLKNNKIRQFCLKMIHNLLPFKINLCRWKLATDTSCMFCEEEETFVHIMLQCTHVSNFWVKVIDFVHLMFKIKIPIDEKTLLIGYHINDKKFTVINLIIVVAQYAVYKSYIMYKMHNKSFHVISIWNVFKNEILCYVNWRFKLNTKVLDNFKQLMP